MFLRKKKRTDRKNLEVGENLGQKLAGKYAEEKNMLDCGHKQQTSRWKHQKSIHPQIKPDTRRRTHPQRSRLTLYSWYESSFNNTGSHYFPSCNNSINRERPWSIVSYTKFHTFSQTSIKHEIVHIITAESERPHLKCDGSHSCMCVVQNKTIKQTKHIADHSGAEF